MNIRVVREIFNPTNTISKLYINDEYFCDVLEDIDRGLNFQQPITEIEKIKVYGATAIPKGVYEVIISYSDRFKTYLPLLLNVPGFKGIRIHPGNTEIDTLGCLLLGKSNGKQVVNSRVTFNKFFQLLKKVEKIEKIIIFIESPK